jgi:tetratricopeptide (TPR) repeat protein
MDPTSSPRRFLLPVGIAVLTLLVFLPSVNGEFLNWDDDANFVHNPSYRGFGAAQLRWMFTNAYGHYMPITWLTLALDHQLWGMNPTGYHATSMALHALNAALLFLLLRTLLRKAGLERGIDLAAAAGALFFSLHPLRVESVSWITERRDVTAGVFFLLTLLAYVRATGEPAGPVRLKWLWLSVASFAAMNFCKSMGMTLPLVLLVLDVVPLRRPATLKIRALLVEKVPFFVLMVAAVVATSLTQNHAEAIYSREAYPLFQSIAQPGYRISFYVVKTLLPLGLSPLYWFRPELGLQHVLGAVAVAAITFLLFRFRRPLPAALAAWIGFLLLIAPVAGIFQAGPHFAADRYTYFASVPFAALFAAAVARIPARAALAAAALLLAGLGGLTARQALFWKDSVTLWTRAIDLDPQVYFTYAQRGAARAAKGDLPGAIADYDRSIELNAGWFESWAGRARVRVDRGDAAGAISDATASVRLDPKCTDAYRTRGVALARLGKSREAIADFSSALEVRPHFMEARVLRANERARIGDLNGALSDLDAAIEFDPQPQLFHRRGITKAARGDLPGAVADFNRALELAPPGWPARPSVEEMLQRARSELKR